MSRRRAISGKKTRLPSEYQEVEYIETHSPNGKDADSRFAAINTGIKPTNNTKLIIATSHYTNATYGANIALDFPVIFGVLCDRNGPFTLIFNSVRYKGTNAPYTNENDIFIAEVGKEKCSVNDVVVVSNLTDNFNCTYNLWLMSWQRGFGMQHRLHYCQIYENDILIRDFVPCYRKSDDIIGVYDLENNDFYTNCTEYGWFEKGADVN